MMSLLMAQLPVTKPLKALVVTKNSSQ